jgi:hypothetical protein
MHIDMILSSSAYETLVSGDTGARNPTEDEVSYTSHLL